MSISPATPRRVLIFENEPTLLHLQREVLQQEGYRVDAHRTAADAHQLIRDLQPDAVILDLCLGGMLNGQEDGWHVLDEQVLDPRTRDIPVIVTSGAVRSIQARRAALEPSERIRVLLKPYTLDQLLEQLSTVLQSARAPIAQPAIVQPLRIYPTHANGVQLTARQREVAALIAAGFTNHQIAAQLVLEVGTVANHVAQILDRLGVSNRAQVAVWAATHGLVAQTTSPLDN